MPARWLKLLGIAVAAPTGAVGFAACSLDLDESLLDATDAGSDVSVGGSAGEAGRSGAGGTGGEAGGSGSGGAAGGSAGFGGFGTFPDGGACDASTQCVLPEAGCLVGECTTGTCLYQICPHATACESVQCTSPDQMCGTPQPYTFHAFEFSVGEDLSCSSAGQCVAALGDFVVVSTTAGVRAWRITNATDPQPVGVEQPPFAVLRMAASGDRVLLVGPKAQGKLSIAWIDLPQVPLVSTLDTTAVAVSFDGVVDAVFPAAAGEFFLVKNNAAELFPTAVLAPPVANNSTVTQHPSTGVPAASTVVASSGTRLVTYRTDTTIQFAPHLSIESAAGTATAQNEGEVSLLPETGEVATSLGAHRFSTGRDCSLLWTTNSITRAEAGTPQAETVSFFWPLAGTEMTFNGSRRATLETYVPPQGVNSNLSGSSALIDDQTALVTVADPANVGNTAVRLVTRAGDALTVDPAKRWVLSSPRTQGAAGAGHVWGSVLPPQRVLRASAPMVHVFDPACN